MTVLGDGRLALGGFVGASSLEPLGESRGVVVVLSREGAEVERHELDRPGADSVDALVEANGKLVVVGRTEGTLGGSGNAGKTDLFVATLAPGGVASVWQWGDARPQHPRRAAVRSDGTSLVVAGLTDTYVPTNYVEDWENPMALEVSLSAATPLPRWTHGPVTPMSDFAGAVAVRGADETFLAGTVAAGPQRGTFVVRLDPAGNEVWRARPTKIGIDAIEAMGWAPDGALVVAGTTLGPLGGASLGDSDGFVAWLDPDSGSVLRARRVGTSGADWVSGIVIGADGTVFLAGETTGGAGGHPAPPPGGGSDVLVAIVPPGDGPVRYWQGGTDGDDLVTGIARDSCGRLYVAGATPGSGSEGSAGWDGFVLQVAESAPSP